MKGLTFLLLSMAFCSIGCDSGPDCRTCTGTVNNTGDMGDFTEYFEDDILTQTNNITGETMTTTNTLAESVAFL